MITDKIIVGIRKYDKKGFVTFNKANGERAAQKSFDKWIGDNPVKEFNNEAISGFKVKDTIGGSGGGWDNRQAYVEIADPRGFNVEITDENFISICKKFGVTKGILDGEYIYSVNSRGITLVNIEDEDVPNLRKEWKDQIKLQQKIDGCDKFSLKNLKIGQAYDVITCNKPTYVIYLGRATTYTDNCIWKDHKYITERVEKRVHLFFEVKCSGKYNLNDIAVLEGKNIICEADNSLNWSEDICKQMINELDGMRKNGWRYDIDKKISNSLTSKYLHKNI